MGPMSAFGYSYLQDKFGKEETSELSLSFVDGNRTVSDIRDWLMTELGPVPLEYVEEYLAALESIDVIRRIDP